MTSVSSFDVIIVIISVVVGEFYGGACALWA
jgi:hypothetical protein